MIEQETLCSLREMYVLGGLTEDEKMAFERHLADCSTCPTEVRTLREVEDWLLEDYVSIEPPSGMKARVLHHVFADSLTDSNEKILEPVDLTKTVMVHGPKNHRSHYASSRSGLIHRRITVWQSLMATAAVAILAVFVALQSVHAPRVSGPGQAVLPLFGSVQQSLTLQSTSFSPHARARVMITKLGSQRQLFIALSHLAPVTGTQAYQVWLVQPKGKNMNAHSLGVFLPTPNGTATFASLIPAGTYSLIAITLEPKTINKTPQGPKVFVGAAQV